MAENLWALREQKKMSVAALANRAGLPIGLVLEYESGQRSIDPRHLSRLARALYVEETQIKLQSDVRSNAAPTDHGSRAQPQSSKPPAPALRPARASRPRPVQKPSLQPRPSQYTHLDSLLKRLGRTREELEAETGKPIAELDRTAMSNLLKMLQAQVMTVPTPTRRRAYLPEAVDEYEAKYLTAVQESGDLVHFTLFDGSAVEGQVIGFGPYTITVRRSDESELTLNKLALVCYERRLGKERWADA